MGRQWSQSPSLLITSQVKTFLIISIHHCVESKVFRASRSRHEVEFSRNVAPKYLNTACSTFEIRSNNSQFNLHLSFRRTHRPLPSPNSSSPRTNRQDPHPHTLPFLIIQFLASSPRATHKLQQPQRRIRPSNHRKREFTMIENVPFGLEICDFVPGIVAAFVGV